MQFRYCPLCGKILRGKEIGDEGLVPYCDNCDRPYFPQPYVCVLSVAINEEGQIALILQKGINHSFPIGVSGYIKPGETAEEAACREVEEELGLPVIENRYITSYYMPEKEMLMLGYQIKVEKRDFCLSEELISAQWYDPDQAVAAMRPGSVIGRLLQTIIDKRLN